nr:hypothetical protein [Streptomyces sp. HNM0574]
MLVLVDPVARLTDAESVRIARDVLCAGSPGAKVCLPDGPEEAERMLARRGSRRPVVIGDDRSLLRAVELLHRGRELDEAELSVVPVGTLESVALTRGLGLPPDVVAASRTVLAGVEHRFDVLIDESGGVVIGGLRIPAPQPEEAPEGASRVAAGALARGVRGGMLSVRAARPAADGGEVRSDAGSGTSGSGAYAQDAEADAGRADGGAGSPLRRVARSLARTMQVPQQGGSRERGPEPQRLRVEADGELLADLDCAVEEISVSTVDGRGASGCRGLAEVTVRSRSLPDSVLAAASRAVAVADPSAGFVRARARAVTVSGRDFHYRADTSERGPFRTRTWTVAPAALRLTVPAVPPQGAR